MARCRGWRSSALLQRGIDGRGETVVLPELAESRLAPPQFSDLRQDFAAFDRLFHLPAPRLRFVSTFAGPKDPWLANGEEVGDAEIVHTIAPRAALTIVLVKGNSLDSAGQAVAASFAALRLGASEGGNISLSPAGRIGGEHCVDHAQLTQLNVALQADADRHVTVIAATGDSGAAGEPCALIGALDGGISSNFNPRKEVVLVASDRLALSVGGTTLNASHTTGAWIGETTWGLPYGTPGTGFQASGGGFSQLFRRPSYQNGVAGIGAYRGVPDVAADANPHNGMTYVISIGGGRYMVRNSGGTSASAPCGPGPRAQPDHVRCSLPELARVLVWRHCVARFPIMCLLPTEPRPVTADWAWESWHRRHLYGAEGVPGTGPPRAHQGTGQGVRRVRRAAAASRTSSMLTPAGPAAVRPRYGRRRDRYTRGSPPSARSAGNEDGR
jgi:hypothetical protein